MTAAIEVRNLRKCYGDLQAVDGISFSVEQGEMFGILGPNGAGKTTSLEIIEGLRPADSGSVSLLGLAPWPRNPALLPRIGVQLQATALLERLTAREQLQVFAGLYGVAEARVSEVLEMVGLTDKAETRAEKLSGGQAQRLSIACAVAHRPEVLFLDEPTAGLDPQARRNLWDLVREIRGSGTTVILTTHYLEEAEALCDRVAIMDHGKILAMDTPAALVRGLDVPVKISLPPDALSLTEAGALPGVSAARVAPGALVLEADNPAAALTSLAENGKLDGIQVSGATLEDVFLSLTGREYRA